MDKLEPVLRNLPAPVFQPAERPVIIGDVCPRCNGMGWTRFQVPADDPQYGNAPWTHPQFGNAQRCNCQVVADVRKSMRRTYAWLGGNAEMVAEMEAMTFANFNPRANGRSVFDAYRRAKAYAETLRTQPEGAMNASIIGPYGVGKTHLAGAIMNHARAGGVGCLFVSGNELFQSLFERDFDESILRQATDIPVLCMDDLDKMQVRDDGSYQKSTLFTLFNSRYIAKKPVIITANADDDWQKWLHPAVLSRLFGKGKVEAIAIQGEDYRMIGG